MQTFNSIVDSIVQSILHWKGALNLIVITTILLFSVRVFSRKRVPEHTRKLTPISKSPIFLILEMSIHHLNTFFNFLIMELL